MIRVSRGLALLTGILPLSAGAADEFTPALGAFFDSQVAGWAQDPVLVAAILAQNAQSASYDAARIAALDRQWEEELALDRGPLQDAVLRSSAAGFLRDRVAESKGALTEAFVTDAKGLNVAASDATSDYWQGDEDKFTQVFPAPEGRLISDVELDESTQRYQGQVSVTVVDPATGQAVGMLTVAIDPDLVM